MRLFRWLYVTTFLVFSVPQITGLPTQTLRQKAVAKIIGPELKEFREVLYVLPDIKKTVEKVDGIVTNIQTLLTSLTSAASSFPFKKNIFK